ncbi:MAG: hypothetical protein IJ298_03655 [Ruminococcus sp.]|nr:hypothetical protein [Ruminococcus sp.]
MTLTKKKFNTSVILLCSSLACGVFYCFLDLILGYTDSLATYGFRSNLFISLICMLPAVLTLINICLERILDYNPRIYIVSIFVFYAIQPLAMLMTGISPLRVLYFGFAPAQYDFTVVLTIILRLLMLIFLPVADRFALRLYSLVSAVLCIGSAIVLCIDASYPMTGVIVALLVDLLYHGALYNLGDYLEGDNEFKPFKKFFDSITKPIIDFFSDSEFDDDDFEEEEDYYDDDEEESPRSFNMALEYRKLCAYALHIKDEEFLEAHTFLQNLSEGIITHNGDDYINKEICTYHLRNLRILTQTVNVMHPDYMSETFQVKLEALLDKANDRNYLHGVVAFAMAVFNKALPLWMRAVSEFEDSILHIGKSSDSTHGFSYNEDEDVLRNACDLCLKAELENNILLVYSEDVVALLHLYDELTAKVPHRKVLNSDTFTDIVEDTVHNKTEAADKFKDADILLVPDLQFFIGKTASQGVIADILESRASANKPTIITVNQDISTCDGVCDELISALEGANKFVI